MQEHLKAIRTWLGQGSINIFGMPYAGKDTQGSVLADLLGGELMGGGAILRNSVIPPDVQKIYDAGGLVPTDDYLRIVLPYLSHEQFAGKPLVLSSVGRWDGEQHGVVQAADASKHPLKAVVLLTVSEDVALARHEQANVGGDRGRRSDDTKEVFPNRLREYQQKTLPVIQFYREQGLLIEVDGALEPPQVTEAILEALAERAAADQATT